MSRVMVTGASGFIGRNLLPVCRDAGHEVHAVSSRPICAAPHASRASEDIRWHQADLLDRDAAASLVARVRPEFLVHLAWYAEHGRFWTSPENVRWLESSLALVRAFASAGGHRVVMAGTCAEYDWSAIGPAHDGQPLPRCEELRTPVRPQTLYGSCKLAMSMVAEHLAASTGLEVAHGRVFFIYGPGEQPSRLAAQVAKSLLAGKRVATSDGSQIRDFLHVRDVAAAFAAILDSNVLGAVNVASGEPVAVREVIEFVAARVGRSELVDWGVQPQPESDPEVLVADVGRLRREVGFTAQMGLTEGLAATIDGWRALPDAGSERSARR